ncbi:AbrB/MazE/SpoVT family DNA-binding domain-containing protein [Bradyrhizobium sp. 25ACV]
MPNTAKVFKSGNSQFVRLPMQFHLSCDEIEVARQGDAVVLRPQRETAETWASLRTAVARGFSTDFTTKEQPDRPWDA